MGYYLGLDLGTNSVGWACTDLNYRLIRCKGKDLWGIREFEEAHTAVDRRTKRISRRRRSREIARLGLVRLYFDEAIASEDPIFFVRLDNSKYWMEDKDASVVNTNVLFNDTEYKDSNYYKDYPTIFHLRKAFINDTVPFNDRYVRLLYLAISNMFKHRGHFLDSSISASEGELSSIDEAYGNLYRLISEISIDNFNVSIAISPDYEEIKNILGNKKHNRTQKKEELMSALEVDKKDKNGVEICKALCGLKFNAKKLFMLEIEESLDIEFSSASYDDNISDIQSKLGDEFFEIVDTMKSIYDIGVLSSILGDYTYLSEARVDAYNEHKEDLKLLKKVMKRYNSFDEYEDMFRRDKDGSYSAYVKSVNTEKYAEDEINGRKKQRRRSAGGRKRDDLYATIRKLAKAWDSNDEDVKIIMDKIASESFLPKQLNSENGVIPNQVHAKEMRKILSNAEKHLDFLTVKDESGLTVSERIVQLFSFHIPYYIGPITERSEKNNGTGWVVRKAPGRVYPWNIQEKIDESETAKNFIMRMVRQCSYINGEKALPKESLIYQKFTVLNEINNLRINGERISVELKQDIFNKLYKTGKKVTKNKLVKYLINNGLIDSEDQLSGIDTNLNNYLSSYGKFKEIFGDEINKDSYVEIAEEIILLSTIFGDSKKRLEQEIRAKFGDKLDDAQIKRILGFKFRDWGRLSREFLELEGNDENGEIMSLINVMWNSQYNMMEIINSDRFIFKQVLADKQNKSVKLLEELEAEDLDEYYFSAPVKRMVWQTIRIIKELVDVIGEYPEKVFVEMTRHNEEKGDKGRKDSRKKMFSELYKNIKDETNDWSKIIEDADTSGKLKSKKMYAYLCQNGKCMYCAKQIDLDKLYTPDYDLDHIYPRSIVKDDNLANNLVLVHKKHNANKSDIYPIDSSIRNNAEVRNLWAFLKDKELINEEKYKRLTANNSFTDEQRADFIARQLVETSQGTKGVSEIIKQALDGKSKIVYAKAGNVSDFRNDYDMLKSRIVNDFHHAQDAYLNIVVGNVYYTKFTQSPINFINKEFNRDAKKYHYNLSKMYDWDVVRGDDVAWKAPKKNKEGQIIDGGTLDTVRKMMRKNTPLMTRMSFEAGGGIAKEQITASSKSKKGIYYPQKTKEDKISNVERYGGYSDISTSHFALIEHELKGKTVRTIECIPKYVSLSKNEESLIRYCEEKFVNYRIVISKINIYSLIKNSGGYLMYISGKMNGGDYLICRNAINMSFPYEMVKYIKKMSENNSQIDSIVDSKMNVLIYDYLIERHKSIFGKRPCPITKTMVNGKSKFVMLDPVKQIETILELMKATSIPSSKMNLELIGGKKNEGEMYISKKVEDHLYLINQSVTGIYEETIDLLTV